SLANQSLTIYKNGTLTDQEGLAKAIKNKAEVDYNLGNYAQADSLYRLALYTFQQTDASNEEDLGQCYLSLGQVHIELGQYAATDSFLVLAQRHLEKVLTPPHVDLAVALHGRGDAARKLRKFEQSETFYQAALAMQKELFQVPNTEIAYTLNHLASLHYDQFQYAAGIPFAEESYQQRKAIFGDQHVETIASKSNLSRLLANTGDYETAMQHKLEIYDHLSAIFGSHLHPYVLGTYQGIAAMYARMGDWQKSADAYKTIIEQLPDLPSPYPVAYVPFQGYGNALHQLGKSKQAEVQLRKALAVLPTSTRVLPTGPISVRYDLAVCLFDTGKQEEARVLMSVAKALLAEYPDFPLDRIARMKEILE
ncbi:MAG: tetratricopeptide repeat protein, partial [Bacteroidota bacterium]